MALTAMSMHPLHRAFVRQPSGLHLDLLNPSPQGWTDEDLAIGLSRTYRWGGHSIWPMPLSVAQHTLTVLALFRAQAKGPVSKQHARRELLHDADEALIGGFDPISPLKPILGRGYRRVAKSLLDAVFVRYDVTTWTPVEKQRHKRADTLAAASEAIHVAGWSPDEVFDLLNIGLKPLAVDPLAEIYECRPWEPWASDIAAERFLAELVEQGGGTPTTTFPIETKSAQDQHSAATA